jgi:hypothetical protein
MTNNVIIWNGSFGLVLGLCYLLTGISVFFCGVLI